MDDEQALLYLGAGDSAQKRQARRVLAERYIEPLIGVLAKFLPASSERESLSEHAAPAALMRLFKKVEADPDAVRAENKGVWRWLLKVGRDAASDERKRRLRHSVPAHYGDEPSERASGPDLDPVARAVSKEAASAILSFVMGLENTLDKAVLLEDMIVLRHISEEEREVHDVDLREFTKDYTSEALRKRRERVEKKIDAFIRGMGL